MSHLCVSSSSRYEPPTGQFLRQRRQVGQAGWAGGHRTLKKGLVRFNPLFAGTLSENSTGSFSPEAEQVRLGEGQRPSEFPSSSCVRSVMCLDASMSMLRVGLVISLIIMHAFCDVP